MKWMLTTVVLAVAAAGQAAAGGPIDGDLARFEPVLGQRWVGHYSPDSEGLTHVVAIEAILSGRAIRISKEVPEIGYSSETLIYMNPAAEKVELLSLTSKGHVTRGTVSFNDGAIELITWPDGGSETPQTRLVFKLGEDGRLYDEFFRRTADGWRRGHLVIYEGEEPEP